MSRGGQLGIRDGQKPTWYANSTQQPPTPPATPPDQAPLPPGTGLTITPATPKVALPKGAKLLGLGTILQNPAPYRLTEGVMVWINADKGGKPFEASLRLMNKADQATAAPGDHMVIYRLPDGEIVAIASDDE